jgi:hypothetical protein
MKVAARLAIGLSASMLMLGLVMADAPKDAPKHDGMTGKDHAEHCEHHKGMTGKDSAEHCEHHKGAIGKNHGEHCEHHDGMHHDAMGEPAKRAEKRLNDLKASLKLTPAQATA